MKMLMSTINTAASPLLPPVRTGGPYQKEADYNNGPNLVGMQALPCNVRRGKLQIGKSQNRSRHIRCDAALNATCAAALTQTVTRESQTVTLTPGKAKTPQLDDNGPGLPPYRDDGNGGNGGGGGGKFSGGLVLLGILGVLDILKEMENEWRRKDDDRRS
ncbi:protein YELLOW LEAF 1, choloroplastic-like [Neltuma alba]|uniref:protein YELLOW LEAF 1, choloroplastic-like n=1 Tax=Neltuma alba TaxID=207710 RepID=UPI0010A365E4|nr:protein YELLOW LEAF 1, choloroplastic-like [Prosopis alba]